MVIGVHHHAVYVRNMYKNISQIILEIRIISCIIMCTEKIRISSSCHVCKIQALEDKQCTARAAWTIYVQQMLQKIKQSRQVEIKFIK